MATVTVLITVYNDARVEATVASILAGQRLPDRILIADGGSTDGTWPMCRRLAEDRRVVAVRLPGSVAATRSAAMGHIDTDILAFLDADETAPPEWLDALVAPIEADLADVTGGPTRPAGAARSRAEEYLNQHDAWYYQQIVAHDAARLPMGNSAWRTKTIRAAGGFDVRFAGGGEDWDLNLRARAMGARFQYVPQAWVHHDQSGLDSLGRLWRRQRRYARGAMAAYRKNRTTTERMGGAVRGSGFRHSWTPILATAKLVGAMQGLWAWRQMERP